MQTSRPIEGLRELKGVHNVVETERGVTFQVDTDELGSVISHVSRFGILDLQSAPPTLEDLFMHHYKNAGGEL